MSIEPVVIPDTLMRAVFAEARAAFPAECCGWLTGGTEARVDAIRPCRNAQTDGEHPTQAERGAETAYVITGADLLAFAKAFGSDTPPRIIYHSHPNGRAYFSATDREVARSPWGDGPAYPVQQLVVGLDGARVVEAALFAWSDDAADFIEIARYPGADL
jgi:[CysO sulfur-carrier protein]-S-L-cysteine hydrolase